MMVTVYSGLEWVYPDSPHSDRFEVHAALARGGHTGFQLLVEAVISGTPV